MPSSMTCDVYTRVALLGHDCLGVLQGPWSQNPLAILREEVQRHGPNLASNPCGVCSSDQKCQRHFGKFRVHRLVREAMVRKRR